MADEARCRAVEIAERYADGLASAEELKAANLASAARYDRSRPDRYATVAATQAARLDITRDPGTASRALGTCLAGDGGIESLSAQRSLVRDVFGNPFRPVVVNPAWLTPVAVALARAAYDERLPSGDLERAPVAILGDALEDAGCADEQFLSHLRGPGPHVRGCFVLDLLLGKK